MKRLLLILALLTLPVYAERVCSVHDGDTLRLCNGERIRLTGIDAPELKQPLGPESRDYLKALVLAQDARLACKGKSFNRRVCRVSVRVGDRFVDVQREMVVNGWAFDSPKYSGGAYQELEETARARQRGVWQLPNGGTRPWDAR